MAEAVAHHHDLSGVPLAPPSANNGLFAVFQRRYLLRLLVRREISARYQGSFLGLLWSYVNPLAQFFVYFVVIGLFLQLHDNIPNFPIHIFSGLIIVHFFTETFGAGTRSIVRNKSIVVKMALPREMFPVATMLGSLYHSARRSRCCSARPTCSSAISATSSTCCRCSCASACR